MTRSLPALCIGAVLFGAPAFALAQAAPPAPPADAPPAPAAPPAAPAAPAPPAASDAAAANKLSELEKQLAEQRADIDEQDARISALQAQLKQLNSAKPAPTPAAKEPAAAAPPSKAAAPDESMRVGAYFQTQYEGHQDSEDQLFPGGKPMNQNRFLLRRARVKLERDWQYGRVMFELDANTVNGPTVAPQHAEVSFGLRNDDYSPMVLLTGGLFDNPFGREVVESPRERPFMERSFASREFFPAEPDLGVRLAGQLGWFRYSVALVNGQPLGDRTGFALQDPNNHKDIVGRVGVLAELGGGARIIGGVSMLSGRGFHPGSDPTKNTVVWRDKNENGLIDPGEESGLPGSAGVPSQGFRRWLMGGDLGFELATGLGLTRIYGELSAGSNMDRNIFIADPITTGLDERELGYYVELYQELGSDGQPGYKAGSVRLGPIFGFRLDAYDPNSDFLDREAGKLLPKSQTVTTYAPLLGVQVPHRGRLVAEYDFIHDALARTTAGVPTDRKNNVITVRLQGEL